MRALALACLLLSDAAIAQPACECGPGPEGAAPPKEDLKLTKVGFDELPGWADDHLAEAVPALVKSCAKLGELRDGDPVGADGHGGVARQWRHACAAAGKLKPGD